MRWKKPRKPPKIYQYLLNFNLSDDNQNMFKKMAVKCDSMNHGELKKNFKINIAFFIYLGP